MNSSHRSQQRHDLRKYATQLVEPQITAGVGKSHVAQALGHLAIRHGADARFLKTSRALAHLAGGHADHTWHKRLGELARPAVLILDLSGVLSHPSVTSVNVA
jgi:hypothetical protein